MKTLKSIGLFFILALFIYVTGFLSGVTYDLMIKRQVKERYVTLDQGIEWGKTDQNQISGKSKADGIEKDGDRGEDNEEGSEIQSSEVTPFAGFLDASSLEMVLGADTEYVIEETDVLRGTVVETTQRLPNKYVGMDRESFLSAMKTYEASPPLSELERGFVGLEVVSFSRQRVVVCMNYRYVSPGESFYLALVDHRIVVYLEDQKTVYIKTEISGNMIPEEMRERLQREMIFVEDEGSLYDFLESYSS